MARVRIPDTIATRPDRSAQVQFSLLRDLMTFVDPSMGIAGPIDNQASLRTQSELKVKWGTEQTTISTCILPSNKTVPVTAASWWPRSGWPFLIIHACQDRMAVMSIAGLSECESPTASSLGSTFSLSHHFVTSQFQSEIRASGALMYNSISR